MKKHKCEMCLQKIDTDLEDLFDYDGQVICEVCWDTECGQ